MRTVPSHINDHDGTWHVPHEKCQSHRDNSYRPWTNAIRSYVTATKCPSIYYCRLMLEVNEGWFCTCASAHPFFISQELLGRLTWKLACDYSPISSHSSAGEWWVILRVRSSKPLFYISDMAGSIDFKIGVLLETHQPRHSQEYKEIICTWAPYHFPIHLERLGSLTSKLLCDWGPISQRDSRMNVDMLAHGSNAPPPPQVFRG